MTRTRIGSDQARLWVRSLHLGNPYAKAILMAVANYVNEDGTAYPGVATIHLDTEIAENTITARLRWCENIGAITLTKCWVDENGRRNRDGRGRSTSQEIRFLFDADVDAIAEAAQQQTPDRQLRGAAKPVTEPSSDEDLTPQISPCPDGGLNPVSPSLAPQQPPTGAARILEEEKESKIPSPTPSKEGVLKSQQPQLSEAAGQRWREFKAAYPDGIVDVDKAEREFAGLCDADQAACVSAAPVYAARCRKRREKSKKAHLFIRERAWTGLLAGADPKNAAVPTQHSPVSPAGKALLTLARIARYSPLRFGENVAYAGEFSPRLLALANAPPEGSWCALDRGTANYAAWRDFSNTIWPGRGFAYDRIDAPWPWPPRKDGSIIQSTDPPGELSDEDARAFTGT
jgi:hypothetical protein